MQTLIGFATIVGSAGLFVIFWPRPSRTKLWDQWPFLGEMVAVAAVSGFTIGGALVLTDIRSWLQ